MKRAKLSIEQSLAPANLWHWKVTLPSGHIFAVSKESFESIELCIADVMRSGAQSLCKAMRLTCKDVMISPENQQNQHVMHDTKNNILTEFVKDIEAGIGVDLSNDAV